MKNKLILDYFFLHTNFKMKPLIFLCKFFFQNLKSILLCNSQIHQEIIHGYASTLQLQIEIPGHRKDVTLRIESLSLPRYMYYSVVGIHFILKYNRIHVQDYENPQLHKEVHICLLTSHNTKRQASIYHNKYFLTWKNELDNRV